MRKKIDKKKHQDYLRQLKSEDLKIFFIMLFVYILIFLIIPYLCYKLFFWNI